MIRLFRALLLRIRDRHDPAAVMQTPVPKFTGYDGAKASAMFQRSQTRSATGRVLPKPRAGTSATVLPMTRRAK